VDVAALRAHGGLDAAEAPAEASERLAQRHLRAVAGEAGDAGEREEHVAELVLDALRLAAGERFLQLRQLLAHLGQGLGGRRPVEADARRLLAEPCRGMQRRQLRRQAAQHRGVLRAAPRALLRLDARPVPRDLGAVRDRGVAEDVRMAADHLRRHVGAHVLGGELALLGGDLGVKDDLQQEVAQFLAQRRRLGAIESVEHLVGLLEQAGA